MHQQKTKTVIGIDEVGRGAWAGPLLVVAARQVLELPKGLKDSKVLSKNKRENLKFEIEITCDLGEGWVTNGEIDELGLTLAMKLAVKRSLADINAADDEEIVVDGHINYCQPKFKNSRCEIDADADFPIVSAASIFAKVIRDDFMANIARNYPDFGFEKNVGYGTRQHQVALEKHGVTKIHRKSYAPVIKLIHGD